MNITKELVKKIADASRITLTESEIEKLIPQLKEILDTFSALDKIDTKDIIGIVFTRKSVEDEFIYNHLIRLAQQYGVPLYEIETEGRDKTETAWQSRGKYKKHKLIWPN